MSGIVEPLVRNWSNHQSNARTAANIIVLVIVIIRRVLKRNGADQRFTACVQNAPTITRNEMLRTRSVMLRPEGGSMDALVVLFVEPDSVYKRMGLDCYDAARDARTWSGGCSVVAHPPCRTWGSLKAFAKSAPADEHALGPWAVEQVRRWGGVLEHPRSSTLFRETGCPPPDGLPDEWGGWTLDVDQFHWGHKAKKATRLYIVGTHDLPPIPRREGQPTHNLSRLSRTKENRHSRGPHLPELSRKARAATPPAFAAWLVALARKCSKHNTKDQHHE